jgi:proline iminopeptidase
MKIQTAFYVAALALCNIIARAQSPLHAGEYRLNIDGVTLWYKIAGRYVPSQAPVLYLHGGPGYNSYSFEKTVGPQLEQYMQMIYLDQRGSGRSDSATDHDYSLNALANDVEALRKTLGIPRITLLGHSFGGAIALEYAARFPQNVQKLIIVDGLANMPAAYALWVKELQDRYPDEWKTAMETENGSSLRVAEASGNACTIAKAQFAMEMQVLQKVSGFHNWQQFHDQRYREQQKHLDEESGLGPIQATRVPDWGKAYFGPDSNFPCYRFATFSPLTMPTLVMVGRYDMVIGVDQMKMLATELPNARFDEFEDSGHFVYAEETQKFVHDVADFLKETSTPTAK